MPRETSSADAWPWKAAEQSAPEIPLNELIPVPNAGLVIASPYLPRLFGALGMLNGDAFIDTPTAERAVHLVQYIATGESDAPEYRLMLNKLLCGLPITAPVVDRIELTTQERDTIDGLLHAVIAHWKTLGNTSIDGLRQSFLSRAGEMHRDEDGWRLRVHGGPFDMLLDRLPWSFAIVKFVWMPQPIHTIWRN